MQHVLALDFDGVISNSLLEAYLITWRIAGKFDSRLVPGDGNLPTLETIYGFREQNIEHWNAFKILVPFCNRGEDYLLAHQAVCEKYDIKTQEDFNSFAENSPRDLLDRFHEEFYCERYRLTAQDTDRWLALNTSYPGVPEALKLLASKFTLAVATSKDRESVLRLLQNYGIMDYFEPHTVLDKSAGASKRAHLAALAELYRSSFDRISFVDDKVAHLIDCSPLGVKLYLAGWGYNGTAEHETARKQNIPILKIKDLSSLSPL